MLEKILSDENIKIACKRVYANKGAEGVDGVTTEELAEYMQENWKGSKDQIRVRTYKPQPVKRVEIRLIMIIWKQWKTRAKRVWGLRKLGIEMKQAILMARMGDRYMVVAHNPTIRQAITKERLTKRGLISLSDYYANVHI